MGRPRRKALYEIIRAQSGDPAAPRPSRAVQRAHRREAAAPAEPRRHRDETPATEGLRWTWLRPGQIVRLPAGYLLVASAAVLSVVVFAYMIGVDRGESQSELTDQDRFRLPALAADHRLQDPLNNPSASQLRAEMSPAASQSTRPGLNGQRPVAAPLGTRSGPEAADWGPIDRDPRQQGLNYFVLAATTRDGAVRLVEFCRAAGLETYAVAGQNTRLIKVIALPGFGSAERSSSAVKELENQIHRIGDRWKHHERGATDLRDAYPEKFGG